MVNKCLGSTRFPGTKGFYRFGERAAVLRRAVCRATGFELSSVEKMGGAYTCQLQPNTRLQARVSKRDYAQSASRHSLPRRMAAPGPSTKFDRTLHPVNVTVPDEHGSFSLRCSTAVSSVSGVSAMEASLSCRIDRVESLLGAGTVSARARSLSIQHRSERSTRVALTGDPQRLADITHRDPHSQTVRGRCFS